MTVLSRMKFLLLITIFLCTCIDSYSQDFTSVWNTTLSTPDNQITIPTNPGFTYDYTVNWGDGNTDTGITGNVTHTYTTPGSYTISISGNFPAIYFNNTGDKDKIIEITSWGNIQWQSMENAFYGCRNLNFDAISPPDLSQVTSLKNMFREANIFNGILNSWNVDNITDISGMFQSCNTFNRPLDGWNTGNITDMSDTFNGANNFNEPLDNWNTGAATTMARMFRSANDFNQNINGWNTSQVTDMSDMFSASDMAFPLNNWNVLQVTTMARMFRSTPFNQPLDQWEVNNVTDMFEMFRDTPFNQNINNWQVGNVLNMAGMFERNYVFNQPLNNWDVSNVTNMSNMFAGINSAITIFNQPLDMWITSSVANMREMFESSRFNQPIEGWDVSNVTDMSGMFRRSPDFNQPLNGWMLDSLTDTSGMFFNATSFNQLLNNWNVSNVNSMNSMFNGAFLFNQPIDLWTTTNVSDMRSMFSNATAFDQNLGVWDISNVTLMANMLDDSGLSETNYNNTLIGWEAQTVNDNVILGAANLLYCDGRFAREDLIINSNWTINDDIVNCSFVFCTDIITPVDGDINVPGNFDLVWEATPNATGYRVTVTKNTGGVVTTILDNFDVGNVTSWDFAVDFIAGDIVTAQVVPFNAEGPAENCITETYTIIDSWVNSPAAFKLTYNTTLTNGDSTPANQLKISKNNGFTYDYSIDWGDNQFDNNVSGDITHTYDTPGIYTISIIGDYPAHYFNFSNTDYFKLLTIDQWGTQQWQSMDQAFLNCQNMTYNATDVPDLSQVENMRSTFFSCFLFDADINNWDVSNVTNMSNTFAAAFVFNSPLDTWDVSNVTNMSGLFLVARAFNQPINNWNVGNVTSMFRMFDANGSASAFNQPLNNWNVSNVQDMGWMFRFTENFNQPLDMWNVSNVISMERMFDNAEAFNGNISNWNVENVTSMASMFSNADVFNQNLNSWNVENVINMDSMFSSTNVFNQPLNDWDTLSCITMGSMFSGSVAFNQPLNNWQVETVTNMSFMFNGTNVFDQDISNWDVSQVTTMRGMFRSAVLFDQALAPWDVNSVVNMESMFENAQVFNQPIGSWDVSAVATMASMFKNAQLFDQPLITWDTSSVTSMRSMFENAQVFNQNINDWDVVNVTFFTSMFESAQQFNTPLDAWETNEAQNMAAMFKEAAVFNQNINTWNTSFVTTMDAMFQDATMYNQPMDSWNTASVTTMRRMFSGASLFNQNIDPWNTRDVTTMEEMFEDAIAFDAPLNNWRVEGVANMDSMFQNASSFNQLLNEWDLGQVSMNSIFNEATAYDQVLGEWDMSQVTNLSNMLDNSGMSRDSYDSTLIAWSQQQLPSGLTLGALNVPYCDAFEERASIISDFGWNIVGDVLDCPLPACTTLISPLNGDIDVPVNTNITWEPAQFARGYRLTVTSVPANANNVTNIDIINDTTYNFTNDFAGGEVVSVTIVPYNNEGDAPGCGLETFIIISDPNPTIPDCTSLSNPLNGAVDIVVSTDLSWDPVSNADSYIISVGTTPGGVDILNNINVGNVTTYDLVDDLPENTLIYVTIIPTNDVGDAIGCVEESFTTEFIPVPPGCTNLSLPIDGATDVDITTNLTWDAVADATGYLLTVGTTPGGNEILNQVDVNNTTTFDFVTDLDEDETYYVIITPYNNVGDATGCIEESFTTETIEFFPDCTSLIDPLDGAIDVLVGTDLSWEASSMATGYLLNVGTISGGTDIINNQDVGNVTTFDLPADLPEFTEIFVNIIPYNDSGNSTGCIEESFTTQLFIPDCVTLTDPLNGATDVLIGTDLSWTTATTASGYTLSIGTTSGGTDIVDNQDVGNVTTFDLPADLPELTEIFVTIIPYNDTGNATGCTEESFTTELLVPDCVSLTDPLNGTIDVLVGTDLSWNAATTADGYILNVGTTSGGTDILNNQDVGNVTTFDLPAGLPEFTEIFVNIMPYNATGNTTGCTEESFTTQLFAPDCVMLTDPLNGATGVLIGTDLSWTTAITADGYILSVGTTSGGTDIVNNQDVGNVTTFDLLADLPEFTEIFVTIIPYNATGNATGCTEESFTTELLVPDCVSLTDPLNGTIDVLVGTDLSWNAATTADGYILNVGTTSGGTDILNNQDVGNVTTFDLPADLPQFTEIFVTIIPYNATGNATGCTEESFTTQLFAPDCVMLTDPLNGATGVLIGTDLSWTTATTADGYILSVGTTSGGTDIINNQDVGNVTTFDLLADLPEFTEIFVTIIPYNATGNATGCTEESFTTQLFVPECTTLTDPLNGTIDVLVGTDLSWNTATTADGYILNVGTTSGGTDIINNQDVGNVTTFDLPTDLPEFSEIFVTIIPYNATGNATGCTEESFTTQLFVPDCVALTDPLNGATGVLIGTDLSWTTATTADGYILSVGTTSGGTDIINIQDVGNVTTFDLPADLPDASVIFVTIIPYNATGNATECTEESFTTQTFPPPCTTIINPLEGAIDVAITATINWEEVIEATGYTISIGTTSGGTDIINDLDVGNTTSYTPTNELPQQTTVFVTVTPYNIGGSAESCTELSFTTVLLPPVCTSLISPSNGSLNVPVNTGVSWNPIASADGYFITIGTFSGGNDIIATTDVGNVTEISLAEELPDNTTIYVTIHPYNMGGIRESCQEESFTTEDNTVEVDNTQKFGFSPDGDGINEFWEIKGIRNYPDNVVSIYNRWGDLVFQIEGYNNSGNVFRGDANKSTGRGAGKLPEGTYFFTIEIPVEHNLKTRGYVVLKR